MTDLFPYNRSWYLAQCSFLLIFYPGGRNDLRRLRIPGVLQRFGVSYLVVGLAEALLAPREFPSIEARGEFYLDCTAINYYIYSISPLFPTSRKSPKRCCEIILIGIKLKLGLAGDTIRAALK